MYQGLHPGEARSLGKTKIYAQEAIRRQYKATPNEASKLSLFSLRKPLNLIVTLEFAFLITEP